MTAPGLMATHNRCTTKNGSREELIRRAHVLLDARGVGRSATWVNRFVSNYLRTSRAEPFNQALMDALDPSVRHPYGHRDPTAERAIRSVGTQLGGRRR